MGTTKFKDNAGREWECAFTVDGLRRARARGVDLGDPKVLELFDRLETDPVALCEAIFGIVEPQAKTLGVTSQQFDAAMSGDAIEHARAALIEAVLVFPPSPRRAWARRIVEEVMRIRAANLNEVLQEPPPPGEPSSSTPASPGSTPAP